MRRHRRHHGSFTAGAPAARGCGSSARSSGVTSGWRCGSSREYSPQTIAHARLTTPMMMNAPRHVTAAISAATSGGVTALPRRENACVIPCAKPSLRLGSQRAIAFVAVGKVVPFAKPKQQPCKNKARQPASEPGHDRGACPHHAAQCQHQPRAELVRRPAADDLEHEIRIGEGREHQAQLGVGKMQLGLEGTACGRDVHAVHIRNEIHHAQQRQHLSAGRQAKLAFAMLITSRRRPLSGFLFCQLRATPSALR